MAVLGIGVSNTPLIKMLLRADVEVTACDKRQREDFGGQAEELESLGAELRLGPDYLDGLDHDVIFRTPACVRTCPNCWRPGNGEYHHLGDGGFFQVCPCKTIAVTGSDGKTTTTTIIAELLKAAGQSVYVGGNIGKPLLPDVDGMVPEDVAVLELSSFQLMTMEQSPDIAVVTNLAPNHLDVHKSMEEYIAAKENIFTHQGADGLLVLNQDNEITRGFAASARGRVTRFSRREELEQGVFVRDGAIWVRNAMHERPVLYLENILLPGEHNIENYMAAIGPGRAGARPGGAGLRRQICGVEHRIELVRTRNGVRYYNDSIASSPSRTIAGLRSFHQKVVLIAGGYDKHIPFDVLGPEVVEHVKALVLTGDTAPKLRQAVERAPGYDPAALPIVEYKDFEAAVLAACGLAQPGTWCSCRPLAPPSTASRIFMERGAALRGLSTAWSKATGAGGHGLRPCFGIRGKE